MKASSKQPAKHKNVLMTTPVSEAESDRRLRPVLDALYTQNSKQALKLLQQALQKRPGWPAARALRACALMQTGRITEAEREVDDIRSDLRMGRVPMDEDCARKLHMYYMETRREDIAAEVYEEAWRAEPANVQLAEVAFCSYVRGKAFSAAQKLATKIHRLASSRTQKYALWATAALWLDLTVRKREMVGNSEAADQRIMQLACAMLSRALDACGTPTAEMVRFAVRVLREAGEMERAFQLVSNPRLVMDEAEVYHLRSTVPVSCDVHIEDYRALILEYDADGWEHWVRYFEVVRSKDNWETLASDFVEETLTALPTSNPLKRGPFLAQLELFYRQGKLEALSIAAPDYFRLFGEKIVCAHDLRPYLHSMKGTEWFESCFAKMTDLANEKGHPFCLTLAWLRLWFGLLKDSVRELFNQYSNLLSLDIEPSERQLGDDYLILAAHRLLPDVDGPDDDRYKNQSAVLQAIAILETGLTHSPFNFRIKLLLIRLYTEVGAIGRVGELWTSLEIKHVQMSTLTYLVLNPFFDSGHHDDFQSILHFIEGLWKECDHEIPECITKAFQVGSINAAVEFVLFRERLKRSAILAEAMVTDALYELVSTGGDDVGIRRAIACLSVMPRFKPEDLLNPDALITNDDYRCYQFWETASYDPCSRLECIFEEDSDQGKVCPVNRATVIAADLISLRVMLRLSSLDDSSTVEEDMNSLEESLQSFASNYLGIGYPESTLLRIRVALNLGDVKKLLLKDRSSLAANSQKATDRMPEHVFASSEELAQQLKSVISAVTRSHNSAGNGFSESTQDPALVGNGNTENLRFSPMRLRKCSRLVFDTLLLTCVIIVAFSPLLMKRKRRAKKAASKANDATQVLEIECFENARGAILEFKQAILSSLSVIETWITSCIEEDLDWAVSAFNDEHSFSNTMSFLPERITPVIFKDGEAKKQDELERVEFLAEIVEKIRSSHARTCRSMLEVISKMTNKMKMIDL